MLRTLIVMSVLAVPALLAPATLATHPPGTCDPEPVGRCGEYDHEVVFFCYVRVGDLLVSATEENVLAVADLRPSSVGGPETPLDGALEPRFYVWHDAVDARLADPAAADAAPALYEESNLIPGLQLAPFRCGHFQWWTEFNAWVGPFGGSWVIEPDAGIA